MPCNTGSWLIALNPKYKIRQANALIKKAMTALLVNPEQHNPIAEKTAAKKTSAFSNRGNWFVYGYEKHYLDNKEIDTDNRIFDLPNLIEALNGVTIAKYKEYLEEQTEKFKEEPDLKKEAGSISIKQQLIILYYLGSLETVQQSEHSTKKALFLSRLLNKDTQNVRKELSSLHNLIYATDKLEKERIKKDLTVVKNLFEELGIRNIVRKIATDILKLG